MGGHLSKLMIEGRVSDDVIPSHLRVSLSWVLQLPLQIAFDV